MIKSLTALAVVTLALAACGSDNSSSTATTAATTAAAPTTVATTVAPTTPTTVATTARTTATTTATIAASATTAASADPEAAAVMQAYAAVFDSSVPFDQKAAHLADADTLRPTVEAYATTAQRFGGIKLVPTAATVAGDQAAVTYDVLFGTTPQYQGLSGAAVRQGGTWIVTRDEFCSFMSSARTPCPSA